MKDSQIVDLFWERSESAIAHTANKYGGYCHYIAYSILHNNADAEECVNDAYLSLWNTIPPNRPYKLSAFVGKITRNHSLNLYEKNSAQKRGGGEVALVLDELGECVSSCDGGFPDNIALTDALNRFLRIQSPSCRRIFVRRYWYMSSIKEIASDYAMGESKVKMMLLRTRNELRQFLLKEGFQV